MLKIVSTMLTKLKWNYKDRHGQKTKLCASKLQHNIGPYHINFDFQNRKHNYILVIYSYRKLF